MLSYRHAFHAGGAADVLKHSVLAFVLDDLARGDEPIYVLDTHAGAGLYDLTSAMALKTAEAASGIVRLRSAPRPWPHLLRPFGKLLDDRRPYPGSAMIAAMTARPMDRVDLVELHPTDHRLLRRHLGHFANVRTMRDDGLAVLRRAVAPSPYRPVVVIDPSYEIKSDYEVVAQALIAALHRLPQGVFLLWYPVIERERTETMISALRVGAPRPALRIELATCDDGSRRGMTASGLVVFNPPASLSRVAHSGLGWLATVLDATGPSGVGQLLNRRPGFSRNREPRLADTGS